MTSNTLREKYPYFPAFNQNNSEYGHFLSSVNANFAQIFLW